MKNYERLTKIIEFHIFIILILLSIYVTMLLGDIEGEKMIESILAGGITSLLVAVVVWFAKFKNIHIKIAEETKTAVEKELTTIESNMNAKFTDSSINQTNVHNGLTGEHERLSREHKEIIDKYLEDLKTDLIERRALNSSGKTLKLIQTIENDYINNQEELGVLRYEIEKEKAGKKELYNEINHLKDVNSSLVERLEKTRKNLTKENSKKSKSKEEELEL